MVKKYKKWQNRAASKKRAAQKAKMRRQRRAANPKNSAYFNAVPKGQPARPQDDKNYAIKAKRALARTFDLRDKNGKISPSKVSNKMLQMIDSRYGNINNFYKQFTKFYSAMQDNFNFLYKDLLKEMTEGEITADTDVDRMMEIMDATVKRISSENKFMESSFERLANTLDKFKRDNGIVD